MGLRKDCKTRVELPMRMLPLLILLLTDFAVAQTASESDNYHSMWVEPNFVDTEYSALFESTDVVDVAPDDIVYDHVSSGWVAYRVKAKTREVYKGSLNAGNEVELLVYVSRLSRSGKSRLMDTFILSFCKAKNGVFYNSRDFLITAPSKENLEKFREIQKSGTDYEGTGNCSGNYPELNPDTHR